MKKLVILASMALSINANASCLQTDLSGTWHVFATSFTAGAVSKGVVRFSSTGAVSSMAETVYTPTSALTPVKIVRVSFKVNTPCNVAATIVASNGVTAWFSGQMDKSKNSITGISRNSTGSIAMHQFVKQ